MGDAGRAKKRRSKMTPTAERIPWSKSQFRTFTECQRKWFLSSQPEYQKLKKLKNRFIWSGSIVHESVAQLLFLIRQEEPVPSADEWIHQVKLKMREEFKNSSLGIEPTPRLFEHEYGLKIPPESWQKQWAVVENSLRWFLKSKWIERIKTLGPEAWKALDEVLEFDVDGVRAFVKIDCALQIENKIVLIDWKSSALKPQDNQALITAALYAHEVWEAHPENIDAFVVSLVQGTHRRVALDEEKLMEAHLQIQEQSAQFQSFNPPSSDPFSIPMTENIENCLRCNFQRLCHPDGVKF